MLRCWIPICLDVDPTDTAMDFEEIDALVLSQACDIENGNLSQVLVCPAPCLSIVYHAWREREASLGQKTNKDAWTKYLKRLIARESVNLCFIGPVGYELDLTLAPGEGGVDMPRVADFRGLRTAPLIYLQRLRTGARVRAEGPFRAEVSQRLGNFLTRTPLPVWSRPQPAARDV